MTDAVQTNGIRLTVDDTGGDDPAVLEHDDLVGVDDGREPVGDDDAGAGEGRQLLLDRALGEGLGDGETTTSPAPAPPAGPPPPKRSLMSKSPPEAVYRPPPPGAKPLNPPEVTWSRKASYSLRRAGSPMTSLASLIRLNLSSAAALPGLESGWFSRASLR